MTRITPKGPADIAGLRMGDKILQVCNKSDPQDGALCTGRSLCIMISAHLSFSSSQVNGWDMTMVTHDQARKRLTKKKEDIVRLLVTRKSLEEAVKHSMGHWSKN